MTTQRKLRKDFDPTKEYSVDVLGCTEKEKKEVQQAFFDVGFPWEFQGESYEYTDAVQYTNTQSDGIITAYCMYGRTTEGCNMTAEEFLNLVYESDQAAESDQDESDQAYESEQYKPEKKGHVHAEGAKTHARNVGMIIYKTTLKLKREFKITKYTKTKPNKSDMTKEIMRAWHLRDGFELSDEEFEDFKNSIKYKTKKVIVL